MSEGDEIPSELPVPKWTQRAWKEIRGALLYAVMLGAAGSYVVNGYFEKHPPVVPATKAEIEAIIKPYRDEVKAYRAENLAFKDSLARLRIAVDTTFVRPMLMAQARNEQRFDRLESGGVRTRLEVLETKRQVTRGTQSTVELLADLNRNADAEAREDQLSEREKARRFDRMERILEALAKKGKVDTKEF
jgi:hypothetical protein